MRNNNRTLSFFSLFAACLFASNALASSSWFVRAHNSTHVCNPVTCDGTSYGNAWKGRPAIIWGGATGVNPGDTLYIGGPLYANGTYFTPTSGNPGAPITITGMTPKVPNPSDPADYDPGILIGNHAGYTHNPGLDWTTGIGIWQVEYMDTGTSEIIYKFQSSGNNNTAKPKILEVDRSEATFTSKILTSVAFTGTVPDVPYADWAPGTVGISVESPSNKVVVYKPSYLVSDQSHDLIIYTQLSDNVLFSNVSYINFEDLRVIGLGARSVNLSNADHIHIERCDISGGLENAAISVFADSDFGIIRGSVIHDAHAGIWLYTSSPVNLNSNDDWLITGNEIRDLDQFGNYSGPDPHGIGIQSGNRITIEHNDIHHIRRSGITFYNWANNSSDPPAGNLQSDNTVAYNIIHDIYDERSTCINYLDTNCANQRGLELGGDAPPVAGTVTGNVAHHNIIYNVGKIGLRFKTSVQPGGPGWRLYNNVIDNTGVALTFIGTGLDFKNNIASNSVVRHVDLLSRIENLGVELIDVGMTHNIYFPEVGDDFSYPINGGGCNPTPCLRTGNLAWWQGATSLDLVGSSTNDPRFVNSAALDFHLLPGSTGIDGGTALGLGNDLEGNPVLGIPDQGAYEFGHGDADSDGQTDYQELCYDGDCQDYNPYDAVLNPTGTDLDLSNPDTDGDGYNDGDEVAVGSDPLDAGSTPAVAPPVSAPLQSSLLKMLFMLLLAWVGWRQIRGGSH